MTARLSATLRRTKGLRRARAADVGFSRMVRKRRSTSRMILGADETTSMWSRAAMLPRPSSPSGSASLMLCTGVGRRGDLTGEQSK